MGEADALRIAIENVEQKIVCEQDAARKADQYVKDTLFNSAVEKSEARKVVEAHHAVLEELQKTKASLDTQRNQKLAEAESDRLVNVIDQSKEKTGERRGSSRGGHGDSVGDRRGSAAVSRDR